jgi:hypothetical protein
MCPFLFVAKVTTRPATGSRLLRALRATDQATPRMQAGSAGFRVAKGVFVGGIKGTSYSTQELPTNWPSCWPPFWPISPSPGPGRVMVAKNWGITAFYNAYFHEPASKLAKLHQGLDALVLKAYGWRAREDILSNRLDLNLELAEWEAAGDKVVGPWVPV